MAFTTIIPHKLRDFSRIFRTFCDVLLLHSQVQYNRKRKEDISDLWLNNHIPEKQRFDHIYASGQAGRNERLARTPPFDVPSWLGAGCDARQKGHKTKKKNKVFINKHLPF